MRNLATLRPVGVIRPSLLTVGCARGQAVGEAQIYCRRPILKCYDPVEDTQCNFGEVQGEDSWFDAEAAGHFARCFS